MSEISNSPTQSGSATPAEQRSGFSRLGGWINTLRNIISNTLFFGLLIIALLLALSTCQPVIVPENGALLLNPEGILVEQARQEMALQDLLGGTQQVSEVPIGDLIRSVELATADDAIAMLVLDLDRLAYASPTHIERLGHYLNEFKAQGKKLLAVGNYFAQHQYYLASYASAVYMHPQGQVVLNGYGGNNFYIKDLLNKLDVRVHVFRAGEFKAAVEPFTRNEMSPEARLANEALYEDLWQQLVANVAQNRQLDPHAIQSYADRLPDFVGATQGDFARAALEHHLVDELLTADQARIRMADEVGFASQSQEINAIDYLSYLHAHPASEEPQNQQAIAVLTVQGPIVMDGGAASSASANQLVPLIRKARHTDSIRALVLRVDSPGGSQFASEVIRQELELLQLSGKPVVASFASAAASGGYWIAATADNIVSESATITGSIGVFSLVTTFEDALEKIGVHSDGVGTSRQTLGMDPFAGLSGDASLMIQARVDHGYDQFLNLVARGRNKTLDETRTLAEGRVWSGAAALELGLVDELGGLNTALQRAAALAHLDQWSSVPLMRPVDPRQQLLKQVLGAEAFANTRTSGFGPAFLRQIANQLDWLNVVDDPLDLYALCVLCTSH